MRSNHTKPTTPEQMLCESLARNPQPSHLGELLFLAKAQPRQAHCVAPTDCDRVARSLPRRDEAAAAASSLKSTDLTALLLVDGSVRDWVKRFIRAAESADPVEALQDALLIAWLMHCRLEEFLRSNDPRSATPQGPNFGAAEVRPDPRGS